MSTESGRSMTTGAMWRLIAATFVALGAGAEVPRLGQPMNQWIGLGENLQETKNFPIKYRVVL